MSYQIFIILSSIVLSFALWIGTMVHIKRSVFISEREKKQWFRTVMHGFLLGVAIYWVQGERKKISK